MSAVKALVADPSAIHRETSGADWVVAGLNPKRVTEAIQDGSTFGSVLERTRSLPGEYTVFRIETAASPRVKAYRGIGSSYDLYYTRSSDPDAFVIGDHFRDVLSTVPVSSRTVPQSVAVDQLLFGTRPNDTYIDEIDRLDHGELLTWSPRSPPTTKLIETVSIGDPIGPEDAKRTVDRYLSEDIDEEEFPGEVATMLSGGVDSTLLQTYLDTDTTVSGAYDSPEFEFEMEYARRASELLDSEHDLLTFPETDFLERLEATIDAAGQPLLLPQDTLMYSTVAESPYQTYLNGGLADGLFGTGTAALAYLADYLGPVARYLPSVSWEVTALKETATKLHTDPTDPEGPAMNFRIHSDQDRVKRLFSADAVTARKQDRLQYTQTRVPMYERRGYGAHMHLGHAIEYFHDVILSLWRHAAHANGAVLKTPFGGRHMLETSLSLPPGERYARFSLPPRSQPTRIVQYKYLPKRLLEERLPDYDTKKPKGHSILPTDRYLESGPLEDVFEEYDLPGFVPDAHHDAVRNGTEELTWYAANYAIWRDRILQNPDLALIESTRVIERGTQSDPFVPSESVRS